MTDAKLNKWRFQMNKRQLTVSAVILAAAIAFAMTACKEPETETYTKDVEVTFPAFTPANTISFAPTYTPNGGWGEHFSASDITYTVTDNLNNVFSGTGLNININDGPYTAFNTYTFTQIFKAGNTEVGRQVIKADVTTGGFMVLKNESNTNLDPQAIPSVSLHLTKTVTK